MSLIGGYFSKGEKINSHVVYEKLKSFKIIPSEQDEDYKIDVLESAQGCLFAKYKGSDSLVSVCQDSQDNKLVMLGFFDFPAWTQGAVKNRDWAFPQVLGEGFADQLEKSSGEFTAIYADAKSGTMHIVNDRFAARPMFYVERGQEIFFSSNIAFLLHLVGGKPAVDTLGVLQVFCYGHTLGSRTNFSDVKRIGPASHLTLSAKGMSKKTYWKVQYDVDDGLNPVEHAEKVFDAFRESVRIRCGIMKEGFVALSGGLDSRLVAGAAGKDSGLFAYTLVDSTKAADTVEIESARKIAEIFGLRHSVKQIALSEVSSLADEISMLITGLYQIHHAVKSIQYARQGHAFHLGGAPGDEISGDLVFSISCADPRRTEEMVKKFQARRQAYSGQTLSGLFRQDVIDDVFPKVNECISKSFSDVAGPTAAHRISAWMIGKFWPVFTFASPYNNHPDATQIRPHLSYKFIDLMLKLPAPWLYERGFYCFMIYHCLEPLRSIPNSNTGALLTGELLDARLGRGYFTKQALLNSAKESKTKAKRLLRPLRSKRRKSSTGRLAKKSYEFEYEFMKRDKKLFSDMTEIINSFSGLNDLFDTAGCMQFLEDYQAGKLWTAGTAGDRGLMGGLASTLYCYKNLVGSK